MDGQSSQGLQANDMPKVVGKPEQMENETLLEGLQNILDAYRDGSMILREMVQNAEDAGASCMKIEYDSRHIDPGERLNISKYFRGPGLCIYNNKTFTETDWKGIKKIGTSFKKTMHEPLKVGRFGQGFKSVFHISDVAVIVSGRKILIIDPLKSERNEKDCQSVLLKELADDSSPEETLACIVGKFGFTTDIITEEDPFYDGTIFWFHLRQNKSFLSSTIYTEEKVRALFESFKKEASIIPLFLRNIKELEIIDANSKDSTLKVVKKDMNENQLDLKEINEVFRNTMGELENKGIKPEKSVSSKEEVLITFYNDINSVTTEDHWIIVKQYSGVSDLSNEMNILCRDKALSLSPSTGVAFRTKSTDVNKYSGHIFCFLPLPLLEKSLTGLPVHVNGFFALEHNRCHIKLKADQDQTDNSLTWNEKMINELLPKTYYLLIQYLKKLCERGRNSHDLVKMLYDSIPDPSVVELQWHPLLKTLYDMILGEAIFYTKQTDGKWVQFKEAVIEVFDKPQTGDEITKTIEKFFLMNGSNLVQLPPHMTRVLEFMNIQPKSITPSTVRQMLRNSNCWHDYEPFEKLHLLSFILLDKDYSDIGDLELLPLNDNTFERFSNNRDHTIYVVNNAQVKLLPGIEKRIVSRHNLCDTAWNSLLQIANEELYGLKQVTYDNLPETIELVFNENGSIDGNGNFWSKDPCMLNLNWIQSVWGYIQQCQYENLSEFERLPLVPILTGEIDKYIDTNIPVPLFYSLNGTILLTNFENHTRIEESLQNLISFTGMKCLSQKQTMHFSHGDVLGKYIKLPTPQNIIECFEKPPNGRLFTNISNDINESCSNEDRSEFRKFLSMHPSVIQLRRCDLLKMIKMFSETDNSNVERMVSLSENNHTISMALFPESVPFPRCYLTNVESTLMSCLTIQEVSEQAFLNEILQMMSHDTSKYTIEHRQNLMVFIKGRPANVIEGIINKAAEVKFLQSQAGKIYRAKDLFNPFSKYLKELFHGEMFRFPEEEFIVEHDLLSFIVQLGLKNKEGITEYDLIQTIQFIDKNNQTSELHDKAQTVLECLIKNSSISTQTLNEIKTLKFVPFYRQRPENFPKQLHLMKNHEGKYFCRPTEIKSFQYANIVGSVVPLLRDIPLDNRIGNYFKWFNKPEQNFVLKHLENMVKLYDNSENSKFIALSKDIFEHFDHCSLDPDTKDQLQKIACIPTSNHGFKEISQIVVQMENDALRYRIDLQPYVFELANELYCFRKTFQELGVKATVDFQTLETILFQLSQLYNINETSNIHPMKINQDRKLAIDIVKSIVQIGTERTTLSELYIPIQTSGDQSLAFEKVCNCTFSPEGQPESIDTEMRFIHHDLRDIAVQLGVTSVTKRTLKKNTIFIPWGQKEPLTKIISNCLDSYADGFSVLKELFQNADDSGAEKISFLFDERENSQFRTGLFDKGMSHCQGPALWVYNNKPFKEDDFENILKIGGETKMKETTKIGKFGLGFCSVYNMTDVPSFISGNSLVVLDPHLFYLGDAVPDNEPGVRVTVTESILKIYPNQFLPYQNIFDCKLKTGSSLYYDGTLFRLPLRTQTQANQSLIRNFTYGKRELFELLDKFIASAANLLLFTQNITEISFYHLQTESENPDRDRKLLFRASKSAMSLIQEENKSFLNVVVEMMSKTDEPQFQSHIERRDIEYEITEEAAKLLTNTEACLEKQSWLISWNTGKTSFNLAQKFKNKGALPVGSVAIPVETKDSMVSSITSLSKVPTGFYDISHVFCFLPLPRKLPLPVHINGCFMVERDRKNIVTYNEDNIPTAYVCWNDTLLEDTIQSAYIHLLEYISSLTEVGILNGNYWETWPKIDDNIQEINKLAVSFYKNIFRKDPVVFYRKDQLTDKICVSSLKNTLFLDPSFRSKNKTGQSAYECLIKFHPAQNATIMDIPIDIFNMLLKANSDEMSTINRNVITKNVFFREYFFPHIQDYYWDGPEMREKRVELIKEALDDEEIHHILKNYECIPVGEGCKLRKPSDLVCQDELVGNMFDLNDLRFPANSFKEYKELFIDMGMMVDRISSDLLIDRASSVKKISEVDYEMARKRVDVIMSYLNNSLDFHLDVTERLTQISFLPVMPRQRLWPVAVPWYLDETDNRRFYRPSELCLPCDKELIGAVEYVCDYMETVDESVLRGIGIREANIMRVVEQLKTIGKLNIQSCVQLQSICSKIYACIDHQLGSESNCSILMSELKKLTKEKIIYVPENGDMVEPYKVSHHLEVKCSPYLYQIDSTFESFNRLWDVLEIPKEFSIHTFLDIIYQNNDIFNGTILTEGDVRVNVTLLKNICCILMQEKRGLTDGERRKIFIPDKYNVFRCIKDVCFEDGYRGITLGHKELHVIHGDITYELGMIQALGVLSKRQLHLSLFSKVLPFGQKEKLVNRIKGIISAYPRDHSILNELLQNADDAGATEIHFVYDMRQHGTEKIFNDKWKTFQGPALCVFNNSFFTDNDLQKIQDLGEGSKADDPSKSGQFGIGFNAVYHLTDVPSFITRTPKEENSFCIFDPHSTNIESILAEGTGLRFDDLNLVEQCYTDVYNSYLQDIIKAKVGTWFRFPLRTEEMARKSKISNQIYTKETIGKLLDKMKHSMKKSLLFLTNIQEIRISCIKEEDTKLSDTFSVRLEIPSKEDEENKNTFIVQSKKKMDLLAEGKIKLNEIGIENISYMALIEDDSNRVDKWIVTHGFGFHGPQHVSSDLVNAFSKNEIVLSPRAGTAKLITTFYKDSNRPVSTMLEREGYAFCFLPLPIPTGLPVHIHGHFALSQNRTQIFHSIFKDDIRYIWNKTLVNNSIAHTYANMIDFYQKKIEYCQNRELLNRFFDFFPIFIMAKEDIWKELTFHVFESIIRQKLKLFPVSKFYVRHKCSEHSDDRQIMDNKILKIEKWVCLKDNEDGFPCYFDTLDVVMSDGSDQMYTIYRSQSLTKQRKCNFYDEKMLRDALIDLEMKITCTPKTILKSITEACKRQTHKSSDKTENKCVEHCICPDTISPLGVIASLKSLKIEQTRFGQIETSLSNIRIQTISRLHSILSFCLIDNTVTLDNLVGVPLLMNNEENLTIFRAKNKLILSKDCELFYGSYERFVHISIVNLLNKFKECFQELDITSCSNLLKRTLDIQMYKVNGPIDMDEIVTENWLTKLWTFLNTQKQLDSEFQEWCLVPCLWIDGKRKLISCRLAFSLFCHLDVFFVDRAVDKMVVILKKLKIPVPDFSICSYNHISKMASSLSQPGKLIDCLYFHKDQVKWDELDQESCDTILNFFNEYVADLHNQAIMKLKALPIFTTVSDKRVHLANADRILIVKSDEGMVVFEGIDELMEKTNTLLVKHNSAHENLYTKVDCFLCYEPKRKNRKKKEKHKHPMLQLYSQFILLIFSKLDRDTHLLHLEFIRDELQMYDEIKILMKNLKFVPHENGSLMCAREYFSPYNEIFTAFRNTELPPKPFADVEWKEFMENAGIKTELTKEQFILCAKSISNKRLSSAVEKQSHLLVGHLLSRPDFESDVYFLTEISTICFVMPYFVPEQYTKVCPSIMDDHLIAYKNSVNQCRTDLCWTMEMLIPDDAVPGNKKSQKLLGIKEELNIRIVCSHIHKVCEHLQKMKKEDKEFKKRLMFAFYDFLKKVQGTEFEESKSLLSETPIIYVTEHDKFLPVTSVVLEFPKAWEIVPYLLKCSEYYGEYFDVFRNLGVTDKVTINHYCRVLHAIKMTSKENVLTLAELLAFESAFIGLLHCLKDIKNSNIFENTNIELYLLNEENVMKQSKNLVLNDKSYFRIRLGTAEKIDFLCDLSPLQSHELNAISLLKSLPESCRPTILTECVKETISHFETSHQNDFTIKLESYLSGEIFIYIIDRLLKEYQRRVNQQISEKEVNDICDNLRKLRVMAIPRLQTVLVYKGRKVDDSKRQISAFYTEENNILYLNYEKVYAPSWLSRNALWISFGVQQITTIKVEISSIQAMLPFIDAPFEEVEEELNKNSIAATDFKFKQISWVPPPGTPVPQYHLPFLSTEFCTFREGDYAVYEIFDNIGEGSEESSIYIYVKIIKLMSTGSETFQLYLVNTGEDNDEEIRSHKLYKVIRPESDTSTELEEYSGEVSYQKYDMKDIFQNVEEILVDGWRLGIDDFKQILRRLILEWHPDKNNSACAGQVFIHIREFAEKLKTGQIDVTKIDVNRTFGQYDWSEYLRRASSKANHHKENFPFDVDGFADILNNRRKAREKQSYTNFANPQPHMGRVWIKQAEYDLKAANESLQTATDRSYNWVCVQSHQAAEKAMKAVQVMVDSNQVGHDHFLSTSVAYHDPEIQAAARQLEDTVVNYSRMRYPRVTSFPKTPSELYSKDQAVESVRLAAVIVDLVKKKYF